MKWNYRYLLILTSLSSFDKTTSASCSPSQHACIMLTICQAIAACLIHMHSANYHRDLSILFHPPPPPPVSLSGFSCFVPMDVSCTARQCTQHLSNSSQLIKYLLSLERQLLISQKNNKEFLDSEIRLFRHKDSHFRHMSDFGSSFFRNVYRVIQTTLLKIEFQ